MNDYLKSEYDQCFSLIKYYDDKHLSLVKYSVGLSSGIPAFLIAIFRFGPADIKAQIWALTGLVTLMTFLSLLILYVVLVQNRLYFIYPARQVNAIRKLYIEKMIDEECFHNQMYVSTKFNAWKWLSSQTLLILFVAFQIGVFLGVSVFSFNYNPNAESSLIYMAGLVGFIFFVVIFLLAAIYLSVASTATADQSIHR